VENVDEKNIRRQRQSGAAENRATGLTVQA